MPANTAVIKWFDGKKGYGFATPETGGDDIFVHQMNIPKEEDTGKTPFIDEGDTIYYDIGDHNGRQTAINVSFPPDRPKRSRRRTRGRNAKKDADDEADGLEKDKDDAALAEQQAEADADGTMPSNKDVDKPGRGGGKGGKGGGKGGNNRPRRNDKGLGGAGPKANSGPSGRSEKKEDASAAKADAQATSAS